METATKETKKKRWCMNKATLPKYISLDKWDLEAQIYTDISEISSDWDNLVVNESFAQSKYLHTLELTNPDRLKNLYVLLKKDGRDVGAVLLQSLVLKMSESFDYDNYTTNRSFWSRMWQRIRQAFISLITFRMLTVGNLYLTGQYGIFLSDELGESEVKYSIIDDLTKTLKRRLKKSPYRFSGVLYKDFFDNLQTSRPQELGFCPFQIDPNMILTLRESWLSFDDYLLDMKSKYRVRLKNAIKKFKPVERRVLSSEEISKYNDQMYSLYKDILEGSGFVLAMGNENYFLELKNQLQEDLQVIGYFLDGEIVGFYTWVMEGDKMDSHFIGLRKDLNNQYQLYLNILLDLVKDGISQGAKAIYYFRTALEIKSSVGAEPHDMACYFKHMNPVLNKLVPPIFDYFIPQQTWKQRHPFKA